MKPDQRFITILMRDSYIYAQFNIESDCPGGFVTAKEWWIPFGVDLGKVIIAWCEENKLPVDRS